MFAKINSAALNGLKAISVTLEVNAFLTKGGDGTESTFFMVGLPDNAVRESKQRVLSALANSAFRLPRMNVTVNLAPADIRKEGSGFDLPLAVGLLKTTDIVKADRLDEVAFVGELGLDGTIRSVRGALPIAIEARKQGFKALFVPKDNEREAGVVNHLKVYGVKTLKEVVDALNGNLSLTPVAVDTRADFYAAQTAYPLDFADVKGQAAAKRAFEVAAAGGHNLMMVGSPGCGKSMMAKRLPSILPQLTLAESLETTQIYSIAGELPAETSLIARRPFRSPHHTISDVALIGGGMSLRPGEISLAHNGVLFLDELPEFTRSALETLRQPLEDREITIRRTRYAATLPCSFMLVAAMNPCPCGYYNDPSHKCTCSPGKIQHYMDKISGPLLDRIDLQLEVTPVGLEELQRAPKGERSESIRARVIRARDVQTERYKGIPSLHCNAQLSAAQIQHFAQPDAAGAGALARAMTKLNLSARAYERILKMARTIADLAGRDQIGFDDVAEAVSYRNLDRADWGESF